MRFFMDILLARISLILALLLAVVWLLRLWGRHGGPALVKRINRFLRSAHKEIGIALLITGLTHGLLSSVAVWMLNTGTLNWALAGLLGLTWIFRKKLRQPSWLSWHRLLTIAFLTVTVWHIVNVGGFQKNLLMQISVKSIPTPIHSGNLISPVITKILPTETAMSITSAMPSLLPSTASVDNGSGYKDGVYTGQGTGYRPGIKVQVTIKNGKITQVKVISHNEVGSNHYSRAITRIPQEIVESQSADVDAVTGATRTSNGIMEAVADALSKAMP